MLPAHEAECESVAYACSVRRSRRMRPGTEALMDRKPKIIPPHPDLIRQPAGRFGWLEDRLLHDGWLGRLGPEGTSVLVLFALAADQHGASFYGRERMADALGMIRQDVDQALTQLLELRLVAHRPWCPGHPDGVWQLLPLPAPRPRGGEAVPLRDLFKSIGLPTPGSAPNANHASAPHTTAKPPDSRAS